MDYSANFQDCEDVSDVSSFYPSSVFESTPKTESTRSFNNCKKRKTTNIERSRRKLNELLDSNSYSPSTIPNEYLYKNFQNIQIETNYFAPVGDEPSAKYFKNNGCERIVTPPPVYEFMSTPKKSNFFPKCSSASVSSPLKEQRDILYPQLKPLLAQRKPLTPEKFNERLLKSEYSSTPIRRVYRKLPVENILAQNIIMDKIFSYLSNGDLYRVSMTSKGFQNALMQNFKAFNRYEQYKEHHKKNKENYKITPPSSPENQNLLLNESTSPKSQKFMNFVQLGLQLNNNQTLTKCPRCTKPSVVEEFIGQCQDTNACGFIFCQNCNSCAFHPDKFYDKCRGMTLGQSMNKKRRGLEDLSNCSADFNVSSIINSTAENNSLSNLYHSSGYGSGYDTSNTSVKRDLNKIFRNDVSFLKPQKALFDSNRSYTPDTSIKSRKPREKKRSCANVVPVVHNERIKIEIKEPASPPPKTYTVCSEKSRKSLKRLTR